MAVIRSHLTRSIGMMCAAIKDEMTAAFDDILELKGNGEHWFSWDYCAFTLEMFRVAKCTYAERHAKRRLQNK